MIRSAFQFSLITALLCTSTHAFAQDSAAYYAREQLNVVGGTPQAPSTSAAAWATGEWSDWSDTCSDTALQTRSVTCVQDGQPVEDTLCSAPRPTSSKTQAVYSSCNFNWQIAYHHSPYPYACEADGTIQITAVNACVRASDNTMVDNSNCTDEGISRPANWVNSVPCVNRGHLDATWTNYGNAGIHKVYVFDGAPPATSAELYDLFVSKCRELRQGRTTYCEAREMYIYGNDNKFGIGIGFRGEAQAPVHAYTVTSKRYLWIRSITLPTYEYDMSSVPERAVTGGTTVCGKMGQGSPQYNVICTGE